MLNAKRLAIACSVILLSWTTAASFSRADTTWPEHINPTWQKLVDISWSTDNGNTWGTDSVTVGQSVIFQFSIDKSQLGNHYADFLKAWIDWGNDGFTAEDVIAYDKRVANTAYHDSWDAHGNAMSSPSSYTVTSTGILMTEDYVGTHWLLARVTCSESLLVSKGISDSWGKQWGQQAIDEYYNYFNPTSDYWQGNEMHTTFTVNPVPEPTTMFLFGTGLIGLAAMRNRKTH